MIRFCVTKANDCTSERSEMGKVEGDERTKGRLKFTWVEVARKDMSVLVI